MVSTLRKVLPKPVYRKLRSFVNPPTAVPTSLTYSDTIIVLCIPRNHDRQTGPEDALGWLREAVRSFQATSPQILRCEMHYYAYPDEDIKVHINWLIEVETTTSCWTCELYQQDIALAASFDRGGAGRNVMVTKEDAFVKPNVRNSMSAERPKGKKDRAEASSGAEMRMEGAASSSSVVEGKGKERLDTIAEEENIELEDMSEVRRGKQPMR
ncbi:MAG: hypothetical protein Q9218_006666 [Villophora microphyllina]